MDEDLSLLNDAARIITGSRRDAYGDPMKSCGRIAALWSAILGIEVSAGQVSLCMIALKIAREVNAHERDNLVDIAGYAQVAEWVAQRK